VGIVLRCSFFGKAADRIHIVRHSLVFRMKAASCQSYFITVRMKGFVPFSINTIVRPLTLRELPGRGEHLLTFRVIWHEYILTIGSIFDLYDHRTAPPSPAVTPRTSGRLCGEHLLTFRVIWLWYLLSISKFVPCTIDEPTRPQAATLPTPGRVVPCSMTSFILICAMYA